MAEIYALRETRSGSIPRRTLTEDEDRSGLDHDPQFTEHITIRKQNLNVFDVASLILNKMVGTGIFTTPGSIVLLNKSKGLTVALWVLGGPYCLLCLLVYLDYGTGFPFNGGELIYLNAVWPLPDLLQAFLFAGFFIALGHTAGNAVAFSRHVILAAQHKSAPGHPETIEFDSRLTKSIAIVILGLVCFLLWISPKTGLLLNKLLALYKILLLLVLGIAGIASRPDANPSAGSSDWIPPEGGMNTIAGLIYIIYSYTGWENANYIIGDISTKRKDLRNGAFSAVALVTLLYTLMSVGLFEACTMVDLGLNDSSSPSVVQRDIATPTTTTSSAAPSATKLDSDLKIAQVFAENVFGHRRGVEICIAISAVGNLIAVAYTSSKVKQAIALHHFLPFSDFFARDDHFMTPGGALLLHWICSSIVVIAMPNSTEGYNFVISLFTYGQLLVGVAVGLGLPRLENAVKRSKLNANWKPFFSNSTLTWIFGPLLAGINLVVMIGAAATTTTDEEIPRWLLPVILFSVLLFSLIYWWCFRVLEGRRLGEWLGWEISLNGVEGLDQLTQMQREERRDGTEQFFKHDLVPEGKAALWKSRVENVARLARDNL